MLEEVGFKKLPASDEDWDGLTGVYPKLCEPLSGKDLDYHRPWLKALSNDPGTDKRVQ